MAKKGSSHMEKFTHDCRVPRQTHVPGSLVAVTHLWAALMFCKSFNGRNLAYFKSKPTQNVICKMPGTSGFHLSSRSHSLPPYFFSSQAPPQPFLCRLNSLVSIKL